METQKSDVARFRPRIYLIIEAAEEGGFTVRGDEKKGPTEGTFHTDSLDDYEPLNDEADELMHRDLLRRGFRPTQPQTSGQESRGELLAVGRHTFTVMLRSLEVLSKRYGFHYGMEQSCATYKRETLLKEEYKQGPHMTYCYLDTSSPNLPLPLKKSDAPLLRDALIALRLAGNCDTGQVDALLDALRDA